MNNELTDWFPHDTVPFHIGNYLGVDREDIIRLARWNGFRWAWVLSETKITNTLVSRALIVCINPISWRGLKHNPKVIKWKI
jgi:hypothetical protein